MSEFSTTAVIEARLASGTVSQIESKLGEIGPVTVGVEPSATDMAADGGAAGAAGGIASSMLSDQNAHLATATDQLDENLGLNEERNDILREILDTNEMIARQEGGGNILTNLISGALGLAGGGLAIAAVLASELMSINWVNLFKGVIGDVVIGAGDLIAEGGRAVISAADLIADKASVAASDVIDTAASISASDVIDAAVDLGTSALVGTAATVTASALIAQKATVTATSLIAKGGAATIVATALIAQKATITAADLIAEKATITLDKIAEFVLGEPSGEGSGQGSGTGRPSPQAGPVGSDRPQGRQPGSGVPVPTDILYPNGPSTPQSGTVTVNPNRPQSTVGSNSGVGLKEILVGGAGLAVAGGLAASDGPLPFGDILAGGLIGGGGLAAASGTAGAEGSGNRSNSGGGSTDSSRGTPDRPNTTVEATVNNDINLGLDVGNSREVERLLSDPEGYIKDVLDNKASRLRGR